MFRGALNLRSRAARSEASRPSNWATKVSSWRAASSLPSRVACCLKSQAAHVKALRKWLVMILTEVASTVTVASLRLTVLISHQAWFLSTISPKITRVVSRYKLPRNARARIHQSDVTELPNRATKTSTQMRLKLSRASTQTTLQLGSKSQARGLLI